MTPNQPNSGNRNFILILLLGMMIIPAFAVPDTDENVWVVQASGNIGKAEKIEFDDYSVKVHEFRDDRVSLAVYHNNNFLELFDFYEKEGRQYGNIRVQVHRIENSRALVSLDILETRAVWAELQPAHAFWGDYLQRDKYGIEIISFNNDSVNLAIYDNGTKLKEDTYFSKIEREYNKDLKIYVSGIDSNGYVDIRIFKKLPLTITGDIRTNKDVYRPDEHINCSIRIFNQGYVPVNLVDVSLSTEPDIKILNTASPQKNLLPNHSDMFEFELAPSAKNEDSNILIRAEVTLVDYFGEKYFFNFSRNVYISSSIGIIKEIYPSELEFQEDETSNTAMVKLTIFNVGDSKKNITVYDNLPDNIRLYNSSLLEWDLIVPPGGVHNITYYVVPEIPGEYTLSPSEVYQIDRTSYSAPALFTVHGPLISVSKTANIVNNTIFITNRIQNIGDRGAYVVVADNIPNGLVILDGNDFWVDVMHPGETGSFNYSIPFHSGIDKLPGASIQYQDIKGNKWYFESNQVELMIPISEVTRNDLLVFLIISFFITLGLVFSILIVIVMVVFYQGGRHD